MNTLNRRDVIKALALSSGAFIFSPNSLLAATKKPKTKLGVALVGLGYYSTELLSPALQKTKNCYLAGIVTGSPQKAEAWQKKYNIPEKNIYSYETFDTIANNDDIDVVYIVLPPSMHREYVVRGAMAGKHVWCEKPMAMTVAECQEMIDACKKNKQSLAIGYRCQHEPNTIEYTKLVKSGALGKLTDLTSYAGYYDSRTNHWKQKKEMGGGALYDMGVYAIQGARLGSQMEPIAVLGGNISTKRPEIYKNGLDETTSAKLEFPGGLIADIKTSFGENFNRLEVTGDKGSLVMSPFSSYDGIKGKGPKGEIYTPYQLPHQQVLQMDDDARAIMQGKPMLVPGEEGLRDIRIVEAIYKSAAENGARVAL